MHSFRKKLMTEERECLLNYIGFAWNGKAPGTSTVAWEEIMYQQLVACNWEHNDTGVPARYEKDPHLGTLVNNQRATYRGTKIIGIVWGGKVPGTSTATWEEMHVRLVVTYKKERKNAKVPAR